MRGSGFKFSVWGFRVGARMKVSGVEGLFVVGFWPFMLLALGFGALGSGVFKA